MTPSQLIAYYVGLLIMEYQKPKAQGMIQAFVTQSVASLIVNQVRSGLLLGTAVGKQLDLLGQLVGLSRIVVGFDNPQDEFSLPSYSDPNAGTYVGFARYSGTPPPNGHWPRYTDSETAYIMADGLFTQFIQLIAAIRASNYSLESLDEIFFQFFGDYVTITDNINMTMTYTHSHLDPSPLFAIVDYLGMLPHPAGIGVTVVTI